MEELTASDKKKVYDILADTYLDAIEQGKLTQEDRQKISTEILEYIEGEKYWGGLREFLDDLVARYNFFSPAVDKIHDFMRKEEKKHLVKKLEEDMDKLHSTQ